MTDNINNQSEANNNNASSSQAQSKPSISENYPVDTLYNILLKTPYLINEKDEKNETFLSYAIKRRNSDAAELILTSPLLDLNFQDSQGNSYLHLSLINELGRIFQILIQKNINVNLQNNDGNTCLHLAYSKSDIKYIGLLLSKNIDINIKNKNNITAENVTPGSIIPVAGENNENNENVYDNDDKIGNNNSQFNKTIKMNWDTVNNTTTDNKYRNTKFSLNISNSEEEEVNLDEIIDNRDDENDILKNSNNSNFEDENIINNFNTIYNNNRINSEISDFDIEKNPNILNKDTLMSNDDIVNINEVRNNKSKTSKMSFRSKDKSSNDSPSHSMQNIYSNNINISPPETDIKNKNNTTENDDLDQQNIAFDYSVSISPNHISSTKERSTVNSTKSAEKNKVKGKQDNESQNNIELNRDFTFSPFNSMEIITPASENNIEHNSNTIPQIQQIDIENFKDENNKSVKTSNKKKRNKLNKNAESNKNTNKYLYIFLAEIKMEKYYDLLNINGFDDLSSFVSQFKSGIAITDKQLKETGIIKPGDRARILIRLQEKADNFTFVVPRAVYHICPDLKNIQKDKYIIGLYKWLQSLKVEEYLQNFVDNGYHSLELLLLQMNSKNKVTEELLKEDIGIIKIGHRARIINKLKEEGESYYNKLKTNLLVLNNEPLSKICDCTVF